MITLFLSDQDFDSDGRIKHLENFENIECVICHSCKTLKYLPNWPNVFMVECYHCPNLIELPLWPKVYHVYCNNCPLLTTLPLWLNVVTVSVCLNIVTLPHWPNITSIWCYNCPQLTLPQRYSKIYKSLTYWEVTYEHESPYVEKEIIRIYCETEKIDKLFERTKMLLLRKFNHVNDDMLKEINFYQNKTKNKPLLL